MVEMLAIIAQGPLFVPDTYPCTEQEAETGVPGLLFSRVPAGERPNLKHRMRLGMVAPTYMRGRARPISMNSRPAYST